MLCVLSIFDVTHFLWANVRLAIDKHVHNDTLPVLGHHGAILLTSEEETYFASHILANPNRQNGE